MVGQVGTEPMSGVAIVNQLLFVFNLCIFGGLAGAGIFTAQFYGKDDHNGVRDTMRAKYYIALGSVALFLLVFVLFGENLISAFLHEGNEGLDLGATTPVGTLTRVDDLDVQGRYKRLDEQRLSGAGYTRLTTLFFPSADGMLLLPAVRTLSYDAGAAPIDCLYTVLEALGSVAADALMMRHVPEPMGYIAEMPEIVRMEGGEQAIEIRFSGELTRALADAELPLGVYLGMLTRTLMGVVPGVDGVHVLIDDRAVSALGEAAGSARRSSFTTRRSRAESWFAFAA